MSRTILFVTGTDTDVGKSVVAVALVRRLVERGADVAALKPFCSGARDDAIALQRALGDRLPLDVINPWYFRAALAPVLAARRERRPVMLADALAAMRRVIRAHQVTVIEGAGGLLSPLGEVFDARDLIVRLRATPLIVCPNRLGAVNQVRLVLAALPAGAAGAVHVILRTLPQPDNSGATNPSLIAEQIGEARVHRFPDGGASPLCEGFLTGRAVRRSLDRLLNAVMPQR